MDMGVTHVIRGDDHLNNTPRQINMLLALGGKVPVYAHVPMILGSDGAKLSKRHGAVSVLQYQEDGYLPDALLNYLVRLGWSHGDQEVFSREEMIDAFDIKDVNKAASAFDPEKLLWLNQQHIIRASVAQLAVALREQLARIGIQCSDQPLLEGVVNAQRERARTLRDMAQSSLYFFRDFERFDDQAAKKNLTPDVVPLLRAVNEGLARLPDWNAGAIHAVINTVAQQNGVSLGKVAQPLRVGMSGKAVSPPIDLTVALIGRVAVLARLRRAIDYAAAPAA
ncbi:MAG TPA: glutamate--tRNA ligase family protein, partial [Steroidobacteraceae bacterium]|nr:glutamate--tRNA ligase family protein [Steroidobacteraceae bacterium]